jgi:hypothetical protein
MDQSQSTLGPRLRTLRHNRGCLRSSRHDPHHAQAPCCKRLIMNPNFPDGLLSELTEVESGKRSDRPEACRGHAGSHLVLNGDECRGSGRMALTQRNSPSPSG